MRPCLTAELVERLRRLQGVALDMDGTIYRGGQIFTTTRPFLATLGELGLRRVFLTNNSSKSVADYVAHLDKMGLEVAPEEIFSSTRSVVRYLRTHFPRVRRLFVLGTQSMTEELIQAGFERCEDSPRDEPDAVVVGFDTALSFARLCRAAWWIRKGKMFIASHPDRICPTDEETVLVDCGAVCAALEAATGRLPDAVTGKPSVAMLEGVIDPLRGETLATLAVVGDRLYTDIAMALRAGALGVLVLTGEASAEDAARSEFEPDLVVRDLAEFAEILTDARRGRI